MRARNIYRICCMFAAMVFVLTSPNVVASNLYVDSRSGNDANPGTKEKPLKTIGRAGEMLKRRIERGPTTITLSPGVYSLSKSVEFDTEVPYTEKDRFVIEALVLPDDPQWTPNLMPVILSTEDPRKSEQLNNLTETSGFEIKMSHVTIRGLRFLGNPLLRNWHCALSRIGHNLDDLLITQCMFVGDPDGLNIYCAAIATGDRFVVDHCIFYNCHASPVFWDGPEGMSGKGNAMRYCIVDGALNSGIWTCQTAEDFKFHHNIVTRSEYFWMRKAGEPIKYNLHDCIVVANKYYSGYGHAGGPTGRTGPEITFGEKDVVKAGEIVLEKNKRSRKYLHVVPGTLGSDLGAGLFKK